MKRAVVVLALAGAACGGDETKEAGCSRVDAAWSLDRIPASSCTPPTPQMRDLSTEAKLAVAVYHFNIQYVAGGLKGFPDGELTRENDFTEAQLEDRIVRVGLEPVLDMFLANPSFAADIELQAYMVEVIAIRHQDVLEKMQTLAARGQIDFDSFHYSDQLYIAYPRRDLEVSLDLVDQVFERTCLPVGRSVFTQEGQFAAGQLPVARDRGRHTSVFPKNLFFHQHSRDVVADGVLFEDPSAPGHLVIVGAEGYSTNDFELQWTFMDDGEIAFSEGRLNPYFGADYVLDPNAIAAHVDRLRMMEEAGFVHATIAEAAEAMKKRGMTVQTLPTSLDGTWQPDDTGNVYRWMGGSGLFRAQERDSAVLAAIWRGRNAIEGLEEVLREPDEQQARGMLAAWRQSLLSQVSDSTGWNPFIGEVDYSFFKANAAEAMVTSVAECAEVTPKAVEAVACSAASTSLADLGAEVVAPTRAVETIVESCDLGAGTVHRITLKTEALVMEEPLFDQTEAEGNDRNVELRFGPLARTFALQPALADAAVTYDLDAMAFEWTGIPLPHGVMQIGGDRWVIQDHTTGRTAALLTRMGDDMDVVRFADTTVSRASASAPRYYVVDGVDSETAVSLAARINRPGGRP